METKLTTITPSYRSFVPDQVLTAEQLNEFLNYFDDQDRLSRIFLSGVGIVCGFHVRYENGEMTISQGAANTTDGDLLCLVKPDGADPALDKIDIPELRFVQYRQFDDSNAKYKPFFWKNINGTDVQLNLLEAIPVGQAGVNDPFISTLPNLNDLVVLLYLENFEEDPSACTGINCENQGIKNIRRLRVLFASQADANYILSNDDIFDANYLISTYLNLDEVAVQRVTVNTTNSGTFAALRSNYLSAMQADSIIDKLKHGVDTMLGKLGMTAEAALINGKLTQLFGVAATYPQLYFQYRYDLLRDVVNAYNELKTLFMDSVCACNPDIHSFPKHVMLGRLIPTANDRYLKSYRHSFYKSPILKDEKNWCERFDLYVSRLIEMLNVFPTGNLASGEIRITPSSYRAPLENKAIPFYYNFGLPLLNAWNYDKYKVNKQNRNLSYHTALLDPSGPIQLPLKYNLEPHNFLAIEGHQGYSYTTAMQRIDALKKQYGLAFDVKALGISINPNDTINIDDYECEFEDLKIILDAWTQEHECLLGKVSYYYSAFSTVTPGYNYHTDDFLYPVEPAVPDTGVPIKPIGYNAVKANLFDHKEALGGLMIKAFDEFRGCSGREIIAQVDRQIDRIEYSKDQEPIVKATLKLTNEVLSYAYVMLDKRPTKLVDVRPDVVHTIDVNATNLCASARRGFVQYPGLKINVNTQMMLINLSQDLTALCCSADKLKVIQEEIERRKQEILLGLSLAKFQEQHPGMEHLAGVHQGDTFLLVYVNNPVNGIAGNTVVADFTLPYLCCSDCRPIGFILPSIEADLRLSSEKFCVGSSTSPIELFPYPANGTVAFTPDVPGMTVNGNQLIIDSTMIPESIIGQPVHFTVNGIETDATLTFYKTPTVEMVTPPNPIVSSIVQFNCEMIDGANPASFTYLWDFGDGNTSTEQSPIHQYQLPVDIDNKVTAKLTVTAISDEVCPFVKEKELEFTPVTLVLPQTEFCESNPESYRILSLPKGAGINPSGRGVFQDPNGIWMFSPSMAGPGLIQLKNNGEVQLVVQVNPSPTANIIATNEGDTLKLQANVEHETGFDWNFTNAAGENIYGPMEIPNPVIAYSAFFPAVEPGQTVNITLQTWNDCTVKTFTTSMARPTQQDLCSEVSAENIQLLRGLYTELSQGGDGTFTDPDRILIADGSKFYLSIIGQMETILSGAGNGQVGSKMTEFATRFFNQMLIATSEERDAYPLLKLYHNMLHLGLTVVRCQPEEQFLNMQIITMVKRFINQMDHTKTPSLPNEGLLSNTPENLNFIEAVRMNRAEGSASRNYLDVLFEKASWEPSSDVQISLPQTSFCQNESQQYYFIIQPEGAAVQLNGSGVGIDGDGKYLFNPFQTGPGPIEITNNGVVALVVEVRPNPTAFVFAQNQGDSVILGSNLQYADDFIWTFLDDEQGNVLYSIVGDPNPVVPYSVLSSGPGRWIRAVLAATNTCATEMFETRFMIPLDQCSQASADYILSLKEEFMDIRTEGTGAFSENAQAMITEVVEYYDFVTIDLPSQLGGSYNAFIGLKLRGLGVRFFNEIRITPSEQASRDLLVRMYHNLMRLGLVLVRCQSEELFVDPEIVDMIKQFTDQMDPELTPSLPSIGIASNTAENLQFMDGVVSLRQQGSASWEYASRLRDVISWIPA